MLRPRPSRDPQLTIPELQHSTPAFRTICGTGALAALPRELDRLGCRRAVVVTGRWLADQPVRTALTDAIGERLAGVFDGVEPHSPLASVEAAAALLHQVDADGVVAIGGGSSVVTGRAASILHAEQQPIRDLCTRRDVEGRMHSPRLLATKIPNWVVPSTPTTAYSRAGSAVRDPATGERLALFDPKTRAQGIILDPAVALTAPDALVSSAALNAFTMTIEGIQAGVDDPLAAALLIHGLRELTCWLPRLQVAEPTDAEARIRLMLAALLSGQGSDFTGGGLAQALAHAAGPRSTAANGVVETVLLAHTSRFAAEACPGRLAAVAEVLDPSGGDRTDDVAIDAVSQFLEGLGVPRRLRDVGVAYDDLDEIVGHAADDWFVSRVPRRPSRDDLSSLLERAW